MVANSATRESILDASDRKVEEVDIPAWGGTVRFRSLPADEWADWRQIYALGMQDNELKSLEGMIALIVICAVAEDGSPLFQKEDAEKLKKKNPANIREAFFAALAASGGTAEEAEGIEENSEAGETSDGSSTSPEV